MASNGLIDEYEDVAGTQVPQVTSTGYQTASTTASQTAAVKPLEPTSGTVDENQLVQGQIRGIIDEKGPLQQQATTGAKQEAAKRGLVNSSMAVTAGQDALYRAAMPIAQQDAATFQRQALENQAAQNQSRLATMQETSQTERFNVAEANRIAQENTQAANRASEFGAGAANTAAAQNLKARTDMQLQQLDASTRTNLVNIEANYKTLMQASQSASDLYQQVVQSIAQLQNNQDLDAASRTALIAQQTTLLQNGLSLLGGINNLNLSQLLDFSAVNTPVPAPTAGTPTETIPTTPTRETYGL